MSLNQDERILETIDQQEMVGVCGRNEEFLRIIRDAFNCKIVARGNQVVISGDVDEVAKLRELFLELLFLYRQGLPLTAHDVRYSIYMVKAGKTESLHRMYADTIITNNRGRQVKAKTLGLWHYVETFRHNHMTLGIGPAGTGKTYLAVAAAVAAFRERTVNRIILTRPAVEAGERLGFLPGDLQNKVDPYLRPLYDALYDMLGAETFQKYQERGSIEVAPLAYMRGRTLDDSFIILDEAQNTTKEQMKMFLTRLGFGSKIVITGDITPIDLPKDTTSGLKEALRVLKGVEDIAIVKRILVRLRAVERERLLHILLRLGISPQLVQHPRNGVEVGWVVLRDGDCACRHSECVLQILAFERQEVGVVVQHHCVVGIEAQRPIVGLVATLHIVALMLHIANSTKQ